MAIDGKGQYNNICSIIASKGDINAIDNNGNGILNIAINIGTYD